MSEIKTYKIQPSNKTDLPKYYLQVDNTTIEISLREYNIITPVIERLNQNYKEK